MMGRYTEAINRIKYGLENVHALGDRCPQQLDLRLHAALGRVLQRLGKADPAIEQFEWVRKKIEEKSTKGMDVTSEERRIGADVSLGMSVCLRKKKELEVALQQAMDALSAYEATLSPHHPDVSAAMEEIAQCRLAKSQFDDAIDSFRQCLEMRTGFAGESQEFLHRDTARAMNHLAAALIARGSAARLDEKAKVDRKREGDYVEAKNLLLAAEASLARQFSDDDPSLCLTRSNLALAFQMIDDPGQARKFRDASLKGYHKHLHGNLHGLSEADQSRFLRGTILA